MREPASWSLAGWLLRRLLSPFLGGDHWCAARRCGNRACGVDRYCSLHGDVLLAEFGGGERARDAARRVEWLGAGTQRRLRAWAMGMAEAHGRDAFNLVRDGYVQDGYAAPRGIVGPGDPEWDARHPREERTGQWAKA